MCRYALLILPSANRVYADAAERSLCVAELEAFGGAVLGGRIAGAAAATIGGVPYVAFTADRIDARDAALLANLSSVYALFQVEDGAATTARCCGRSSCGRWTGSTTTCSPFRSTRVRRTSSSPSCC
jgi:hypothetical protein